ncbi:hypothetical protein DLAC_05515 [Tieghemostelium lacteum]|uniref:G-patch domain-containing protein n=1 Tax=Tieghemostelium lacteum TaxID=361077 RepID=A0A151ZG23_TIELA|nr:hypothetical protein DLAC_05515 [Tieghemostelium lacteum]|eukprot:KYQ92921.1 hypothetical protein DLAC_05515 [Tieghemostelium lacteum]
MDFHSKEEHLSSTIHIVSERKQEGYKPKSFYKLTSEHIGYRILKNNMGWNEDGGLGKDEQGRSTPIKVSIKQDKLGIGNKVQKSSTQTVSSPTTPKLSKRQKLYLKHTLKKREERIKEIVYK